MLVCPLCPPKPSDGEGGLCPPEVAFNVTKEGCVLRSPKGEGGKVRVSQHEPTLSVGTK